MGELVCLLCAITSIVCAGLLWRQWRRRRGKLLFWSSAAFAGLAVNNTLLFIDFMVPSVDLVPARNISALVSMVVLLFGLVWSSVGDRP